MRSLGASIDCISDRSEGDICIVVLVIALHETREESGEDGLAWIGEGDGSKASGHNPIGLHVLLIAF